MKKFKALILGLTMVCAVGMFTACGEVPEVSEDDVMDALEDEGIITDEMDEESYSVEIKETELNDEKNKADVTCVFTVTQGYIKYETEYELKFKLKDDKESWKYRDKIEAGEVKETLAKGIDEDDIEDELSWEYLEIDGNYFEFGYDITDYEVTDQETDLEEKTDVLTIEGTVDSGFTTYEFTAELTFTYDWGWYLEETEVTEYETTYAEGYATDIDEDTLKEDLMDSSSYIYAEGFYYYFSDATSLDVTVTDMQRNNSYATVTADVVMEYNGVTVSATVEVEYYYYEYDKEWDYNYFNDYEVTSWDSDIFGTYTGTDANGTTYTLTIKNEKQEWNYFYAEVSITNATETYSYSAYVGQYDPDDGYICVYSNEWIVEPVDSWTWMESFYGYIADGKYTEEYGDYTLTKQ